MNKTGFVVGALSTLVAGISLSEAQAQQAGPPDITVAQAVQTQRSKNLQQVSPAVRNSARNRASGGNEPWTMIGWDQGKKARSNPAGNVEGAIGQRQQR
jgi:hypothetical protein